MTAAAPGAASTEQCRTRGRTSAQNTSDTEQSSARRLSMTKRPRDVQEAATLIDRGRAEKMCQKKLRKSPTLYKRVLIQNTLKFVQEQASDQNCFLPFPADRENSEPEMKRPKSDEDVIDAILTEMIFPRSSLPSPEELSFDWPQPPETSLNLEPEPHLDSDAIVPDIDIVEDIADDNFLLSVLGDRTNCTVMKLPPSKCVYSSKHRHLQQSDEVNQTENMPDIKPDITLLPATLNIFISCDGAG